MPEGYERVSPGDSLEEQRRKAAHNLSQCWTEYQVDIVRACRSMEKYEEFRMSQGAIAFFLYAAAACGFVHHEDEEPPEGSN